MRIIKETENIKNVRVYGLPESLIASGYPMRGEFFSGQKYVNLVNEAFTTSETMIRSKRLGSVKSGSGHDSFLKGAIVQFDWNTPVAYQPHILRYHFIDIISSQSSMHRVITLLKNNPDCMTPKISGLVEKYLEIRNDESYSKNEKLEQRQKIILNLPQSFSKVARYSTNYLQLKTMIMQRLGEPIKMWQEFISFMMELPLFAEICFTEKQIEAINNRKFKYLVEVKVDDKESVKF